MKIILIGNYLGDRQESMWRYSLALQNNLRKNGVQVEMIYPQLFFAPTNKVTTEGFLKWLGYIDKYFVFPFVLRRKVMREFKKRQDVFFHICDHSNSIYLEILPKKNSGITCHDVLAIQGALGFKEACCPATRTGRLLQTWILKNLKKSKILTTVSQYTMDQLSQLCGIEKGSRPNWKVIHNSFNSHFWPMDEKERRNLLNTIGFPEKPFILHVGSGLPRKNRNLLLRMVNILGGKWNGNICFAGDPLDNTLLKSVEDLDLQQRVISVARPDHQTLVALYSSCAAFIFPSFSEGFGWPLIEAQACGAPVLASSISSLREVGGETVVYADPHKPEEFAESFLNLFQNTGKDKLTALGFENCKRFESQKLTREFIGLYRNNQV